MSYGSQLTSNKKIIEKISLVKDPENRTGKKLLNIIMYQKFESPAGFTLPAIWRCL